MLRDAISIGGVFIILLVSVPLAAAVSFVLLRLYRRSVLRGMQAQAGMVLAPTPPPGPAVPLTANPRPLLISTADAEQPAPAFQTADAIYSAVTRSLKRAAVVYTMAGLVYALVLASAWMLILSDGFYPFRFLWFVTSYAWPIVLALGLMLAIDRAQRIRVAAVYLAIAVALDLVALIRSPGTSALGLLGAWLWLNGPPTLLLLGFLVRKLRAVGPLVLAFVVAGVVGSQVISFGFVDAWESYPWLAKVVDLVPGSDPTVLLLALWLVGFAMFGALGWWLLRRLGREYQQKRFGDQALTLDALWLFFAVLYGLDLANESPAWALAGLLAFAAYKLVVRIGFARLTSASAPGSAGPRLLLLRVFSLGQRSEGLFDAISIFWLRAGSIAMIAGPDLVTSIVEPHEFLDFVGGGLARQFVAGEADLEERLGALDTRPDPDGRYRVNEFFCRADTWQMTMRRLAAGADAVLMDVRSFSPSNAGIIYELRQLLAGVPLDRVVLVVDETTELPFLEQTLQTLWQQIAADSPNRNLGSPEVRLFYISSGSARQVRGLFRLLSSRVRVAAAGMENPPAEEVSASPA